VVREKNAVSDWGEGERRRKGGKKKRKRSFDDPGKRGGTLNTNKRRGADRLSTDEKGKGTVKEEGY